MTKNIVIAIIVLPGLPSEKAAKTAQIIKTRTKARDKPISATDKAEIIEATRMNFLNLLNSEYIILKPKETADIVNRP